MAQIQTYRDPRFGNRWVSGGMSSARGLKQTYGKYLVRFRIDKGRGVKYALLLWPSTLAWPYGGEIDFGEDSRGDRKHTTATTHYSTDGEDHHLRQLSVAADFSQWHTLGVEWTARKAVFTLDGKKWGKLNSVHIPSAPMELVAQAETGTCGDPANPCPDATTPRVNLQIDWVAAYRPAT